MQLKYFTDELNDIKGYIEQLKALKLRLSNISFCNLYYFA